MLRNRMFLVAVCLMLSLWGSITVSAQTNLLSDPGFEGNYTGRGRSDFNFPEAWDGWYTQSPHSQDWMNIEPIAFPHSGGFKRAGQFSQSIGRGSGTITAAVFQQVPNIAAGTRLKASAWVFLENVSESNAQVRIGIGTNVGGNPTAGGITWSNWMKTVQSWQQISVEAVSAGGTVTVFIYTDQVWPNDPNALYIDEASLVATGTGEVPPNNGGNDGNGGGAGIQPLPTTAPPQNVVPFASAQGAREDGSIVHRVVSGDTIASIAVAYGVTQQEILSLNNIANAGLISVGQELLIKPAPTAAPIAEATEKPADEDATTPAVDEPAVTETAESPDSTVVAQEPTAAPTEAPTNEPEPTAIPSTPTTAPTAPVISEANGDVFPSGNPAEGITAICVLMFDDVNQNRVLEVGENALASGTITISGSAEPTTYVTNGESEPFCLELEPGDYTASATPPQGYGLTTPRQLIVRVESGVQFSVNFGAAEGVTMAAVPTSDAAERAALTDSDAAPETSAVPSDPIRDNIGLIIFGLAGLVLVGGLGLSVVLRQR